jgi:glycosyltransferase involved in cell wall biosynthesis
MASLLEQGREGLLAGSDAGVVDALVRLGEDAALLARISRNNREVAPAVSWSRTVARHLELYERALDTAGRGVPTAV